MFRLHTAQTIFLLSVGTLAGSPLLAPAQDTTLGPPAPPATAAPSTPANQPANSGPTLGPPAKIDSSKPAAKPGAPAPGTVIAPTDLGQPIPPPPAASNGPQIPGLGNFLRPDGGIDLPGGVGTIHRGTDTIGIQINTQDGPLQINIPRRERNNAAAAEEPPGPEGEAPIPGSRGGARRGRASHEFALASRVFHARNYPAALRRINRYLERDPGDRDLLQLRSLTNFAMGDYRAAYRDALSAATVGDVWDWTTVRSLYRSAGEYSAQYRALEDYVAANPGSADPAFLFAYHNLMIGNQEAARREFARVAAIDPGNEAARRLATGEGPPQPRANAAVPGARAKSQPRTTQPLAPPQEKLGSGPSVDFGQPAAPNQAAPQGQK